MMLPGLVSVSFRPVCADELIRESVKAGISCIEWGGDIHVPAGDEETARRIALLTKEAGLSVSAYGSYYRAGFSEDSAEREEAFGKVLRSALILKEICGCDLIRVWAGRKGSADISEEERTLVTEDLARITSLAKEKGLRIGMEFHANTLTDEIGSLHRILREIPDIFTYWQPPVGRPAEQNRRELASILPRLCAVHCYAWEGHTRLPLAAHAGEWADYLALIRKGGASEKPLPVSLEFVKDDSPAQYGEDAETLISLTEAANNL